MEWKSLMERGFFPEVLPPCFISHDFSRALNGIHSSLSTKKFHRARDTRYISYSGTKHNGSRRAYGTPNPIPYYLISQFISNNWKTISRQYRSSPYSVSNPKIGDDDDDRAVIVSSLSELSQLLSEKIRYAPYILKTDVSQFFPSIYTHSIPWVAHGKERSKLDRAAKSKTNRFNRLDFFIQNIQSMQTQGVLVGPDAFRIVAEFVACQIDLDLKELASEYIVGAVRHVDDFYIGVRSEVDAIAVLSHLRDVLQSYELQLNDSKTTIINGLMPIDDVWAQELRALPLSHFDTHSLRKEVTHLLDKAFELTQITNSESPMKMAIRRLDQAKIYQNDSWQSVEPILQRILFHFPHCIDYVALLAVKRHAIGEDIDRQSWKEACEALIHKHLGFRHHHEITWLSWLLLTCELDISRELVSKIVQVNNSHLTSMLIAAHSTGLCSAKPNIAFPNNITSTDENWLTNIVARTNDFTKAHFGGSLAEEFEHFSSKRVRLIDFNEHLKAVDAEDTFAISRSRYGYDDENYDEDDFLALDEELF